MLPPEASDGLPFVFSVYSAVFERINSKFVADQFLTAEVGAHHSDKHGNIGLRPLTGSLCAT